jgi:hypothetical protein
MKTKSSKMSGVDLYLGQLKPPIKDIAVALRALIKEAAPKAEESIKWGMPVYMSSGLLCSIMAAKRHVSFIFYDGIGLSDPKGFLEGSGKKMKLIKFRELKEVKKGILQSWIKQAIKINAETKRG